MNKKQIGYLTFCENPSWLKDCSQTALFVKSKNIEHCHSVIHNCIFEAKYIYSIFYRKFDKPMA